MNGFVVQVTRGEIQVLIVLPVKARQSAVLQCDGSKPGSFEAEDRSSAPEPESVHFDYKATSRSGPATQVRSDLRRSQ